MVECRDVTIKNKLGLHARAAALFVQTVSRYKSDVYLEKDGHRVNGKSIMGVMMLAAAKGSSVRVEASGADAGELVTQVEQLVDNLFGEAE